MCAAVPAGNAVISSGSSPNNSRAPSRSPLKARNWQIERGPTYLTGVFPLAPRWSRAASSNCASMLSQSPAKKVDFGELVDHATDNVARGLLGARVRLPQHRQDLHREELHAGLGHQHREDLVGQAFSSGSP